MRLLVFASRFGLIGQLWMFYPEAMDLFIWFKFCSFAVFLALGALRSLSDL